MQVYLLLAAKLSFIKIFATLLKKNEGGKINKTKKALLPFSLKESLFYEYKHSITGEKTVQI